jgi:hypothetical protein
MIRLTVPASAGTWCIAATKAAIEPFMSTAPRPEQLAPALGREGPAGPALAGRHDIDMARIGEVAAALGAFADGERFSTGPSGASPVMKR